MMYLQNTNKVNNYHLRAPCTHALHASDASVWHLPIGSTWGIAPPAGTSWILQNQMNVWLIYHFTCHWGDKRNITKVHKNYKTEISFKVKWMHHFVLFRVPVMCCDRTSVKSVLKVPPSNTSHPSVAMRLAITGALPPTDHLFPGKSRAPSTSSLKRVSFSIKRLWEKKKNFGLNCESENWHYCDLWCLNYIIN